MPGTGHDQVIVVNLFRSTMAASNLQPDDDRKAQVCGSLQRLAGSVNTHFVLDNSKQIRARQPQELMQR
jgi:hypothetical protein